jgi:hypothetical protein
LVRQPQCVTVGFVITETYSGPARCCLGHAPVDLDLDSIFVYQGSVVQGGSPAHADQAVPGLADRATWYAVEVGQRLLHDSVRSELDRREQCRDGPVVELDRDVGESGVLDSVGSSSRSGLGARSASPADRNAPSTRWISARLSVTSMDAWRIASAVAVNYIPIQELTPRGGSLEDAYRELTNAGVEDHARFAGYLDRRPAS